MLTVALINGDISMNCWQKYMSTSERRKRGAESDQINITGGNSSPAYYLERYDGGREEGGVEM